MDDGSGNRRPVQCGRRTSDQRHQKDTEKRRVERLRSLQVYPSG